MEKKCFLTARIFSAIYFVINFIFMMLGVIPIMWILMPGFIALFTGIPFMLLCAKVQKPGAVLIMGGVTGIIYFITGQFTVVRLVTFIIACGLAEITRALTKYNSFKGNLLAFVFFSLGMIGSPLPIWLFRDSFFAKISEKEMPSDYITSLQSFSSDGMLIVLIVAPIVGVVVGAIIARMMFKKHFTKAGIV